MIATTRLFRLLLLVGVAMALSDGGISAQQKEAFTEERFAALQEQNALILLDVFADWCPTCAKQQKVIAAYRQQHPEVPLHVLTIDFDDQKQYVKRFEAPRQSMLILYRGKQRVWFSVAETRAEPIFAALNGAAAAPRR